MTSTPKPVPAVLTRTKVLVLATLSGGYAAADTVGQLHASYPCNTFVLPVRDPAMFPERFYIAAFEAGMDAILVMYSGTDNPYHGGSERVAAVIDATYPVMKARGMDPRRLRLVAICSVCSKAFLREIQQMGDLLQEIGPASQEAILAEANKSTELCSTGGQS